MNDSIHRSFRIRGNLILVIDEMNAVRSDFLRLYATKDVVIECFRTTEKLELRSRHRLSIQQFEFFKVQGANQIRKLKETVFFRANVLHKLNRASDTLCNLIVEKFRNWRLAAIIIDFADTLIPISSG